MNIALSGSSLRGVGDFAGNDGAGGTLVCTATGGDPGKGAALAQSRRALWELTSAPLPRHEPYRKLPGARG